MRSRKRERLIQLSRVPRWLWGTGAVLGLVVAIVCVLLITHNRGGSNPAVVETSEPNAEVSETAPSAEPLVSIETTPEPELPELAFVAGSVEDVCGFNELPTYWIAGEVLKRHYWHHIEVLETNGECRAALDAHMSAYNPLYFLSGAPYRAHLAEFVILDEPFTFERIFADTVGDFVRVQDALSRPECLLTGDETNRQLTEDCHADAFLNYAFVNLFCFSDGIENRVRPVHKVEDSPTLEQDRQLWKQQFEDEWAEQKCEGLDPALELTAEHYPELYTLILSLKESEDSRKEPLELLVELAARLGDDAAGLTQVVYRPEMFPWSFKSEGYRYGRITDLVGISEWTRFAFKEEPKTDRFRETFYMLAKLSARRPNPHDEIEFDWEYVARHLCDPPYFETTWSNGVQPVENADRLSCKEVVHEIRQQDIKFAPLLQMLDKFEQVALELDVYE